jgi:hypothetical protein
VICQSLHPHPRSASPVGQVSGKTATAPNPPSSASVRAHRHLVAAPPPVSAVLGRLGVCGIDFASGTSDAEEEKKGSDKINPTRATKGNRVALVVAHRRRLFGPTTPGLKRCQPPGDSRCRRSFKTCSAHYPGSGLNHGTHDAPTQDLVRYVPS